MILLCPCANILGLVDDISIRAKILFSLSPELWHEGRLHQMRPQIFIQTCKEILKENH